MENKISFEQFKDAFANSRGHTSWTSFLKGQYVKYSIWEDTLFKDYNEYLNDYNRNLKLEIARNIINE